MARKAGPPIRRITDDVLVRCPRCAACAYVTRRPGESVWEVKLVCASCGLSEWKPEGRAHYRFGEAPFDPWFALPLWFQAEFRGHLLWAFNREHLEILRVGIESKHRDLGVPGARTMLNKLPKWMLLGKNREDLLRKIERLQRL